MQKESSLIMRDLFTGKLSEPDLGHGGFRVFLKMKPNLYQRLHFSVSVPLNNKPEELHGVCQICWLEEENSSYWAGLEVIYLEPRSRELFIEWIKAKSPKSYIPKKN